jgi:hypothetical protein
MYNFIVMDGRGVVCREFESSKLVHVSEVKYVVFSGVLDFRALLNRATSVVEDNKLEQRYTAGR